MTISYNWLSEYLPERVDAIELSNILTSIGLEVESLETFEEIKGNLQGLIIGEVTEVAKHPDADKLSVTKVNTGAGTLLQIVCGAPNVAVGQKVVVAPVGATIYPLNGASITMKKAKIRGIESFGMICAEDEIGLGEDHSGILVLAADAPAGIPAADYIQPYQDLIYEIGLTPNRMDAMSHVGVAKDVCAFLSHHNHQNAVVRLPLKDAFVVDNSSLQLEVVVNNTGACKRYSGVSIQGVSVGESPKWLQQRLKSIGLRPINNIVDITNFILHEFGQPLHAFDFDMISGRKIIVGNLAEGTPFITLDGKEKKLFADDLMICNDENAMCIGGVYGGLNTGVTKSTKNIFLESAWFNPTTIRKTSLQQGLRTDAATRFEKGVDISNTVNVLKRAAALIQEIAGGQIASDVIDMYPFPRVKTEVVLEYAYLKKLSGKTYAADTIRNILLALDFEIVNEGMESIAVAVPFSKADISIPADIVEEIMRIDGLDNVEIPAAITISPSVESLAHPAAFKEKVASFLVGSGFNEIFTNSITNAAYYNEEVLQTTVKMINSLSAELNIMRPAMMEGGLETVAYNYNRRNTDLRLFEFGKTYSTEAAGSYTEQQHLSLYITGKTHSDGWKIKGEKADLFYVKGICEKIFSVLGLKITGYTSGQNERLDISLQAESNGEIAAVLGRVDKKILQDFALKQPVFFIDIDWDKVLRLNQKNTIRFKEIARFPSAVRDLSIVVSKNLPYAEVEKVTHNARIGKLQSLSLFDVFENEKLGDGKKAMAISYTFLDEEKTLTDKDIDAMMSRIVSAYEKELGAEIRK